MAHSPEYMGIGSNSRLPRLRVRHANAASAKLRQSVAPEILRRFDGHQFGRENLQAMDGCSLAALAD
jgi:hypothetical protein